MSVYSFRETDRKYSYRGLLGAEYAPKGTKFSVWSPYAESITLRLYKNDDDGTPEKEIKMHPSEDGAWRTEVCGDLDGKYYTYAVTHDGITRETADIYSRSAGLNGKRGMIFSEGSVSPVGWEDDCPVRCASPTDAVICELHVRDFSMDENGSFTLRGKLGAFSETGVTNSFGDTIGLDYLQYLGVTHVHLLPVMENSSVDERDPTYNWGYDPYLYNVPEGSYCSDPNDGRCRVKELRSLVQALHSRGIGVIFDVVYNHTYSTENSPFDIIFPHYYYRHDGEKYSDGSGCGNELASERAMVRKFIVDSVCELARDYHADGFRFDLMGLTDIVTMNMLSDAVKKINPYAILYGEGWTGGLSPLSDDRRALKHHVSRLKKIAMFSDDFRDGIKGSVFSDRDCGYINGTATAQRRELICSVLCGGVYHPDIPRGEWECWAKAPLHSVNYVECHDNLTFRDKLRLSMPKADENELIRVNRLGAALVLLSQGIPFFALGQEILRSKPENDGYSHNSYNSPDSVNCIKWDDVTTNRSTVEYYRGLIAIRKGFPELRMRTAAEIRRIRFEYLAGAAFAAHIGGLLLIVNPHRRNAAIRLQGEYEILANGECAGTSALGTVRGKTSAAPQSILLLKRLS